MTTASPAGISHISNSMPFIRAVHLHAFGHKEYKGCKNKDREGRDNDHYAPARIHFLLSHHRLVNYKGVGHSLLAKCQCFNIPPPYQAKVFRLRVKSGICLLYTSDAADE